MSKTALQTVQRFQTSLGSGTDEWQKVISDKITFKGPAAEAKGKTEFIKLNEGFFPMV